MNRRFDYAPAVIVACATDQDVVKTILFARERGLRISIRAGGTSPAGFSSNDGGVLIDLSRFCSIAIDTRTMTVKVGAGVIQQQLLEALSPTNLTVPMGECMSVGLTGLALGGGFGLLSRSLSLTCDSILEATIVTAQGLVVTVSDLVNPDLYWALRGAGGGNFGVVTSLTMRLHQIPPAVAFASVVWPLAQAAQVLSTLLPYFADEAPDELGAIFSMLPLVGMGRTIGTMAVYNGPPEQATDVLARLTGTGKPIGAHVGRRPYSELMFDLPQQAPDISNYFKSGFVNGVLPREGIGELVEGFVSSRQIIPSLMNMVSFEVCGGAISRIAPTATAFVHRRKSLLLSIVATSKNMPGAFNLGKQWADGICAKMQPYFSGEVYQNYPDLDLPGYERAYYGENLERLKTVKRTFDPDNVFWFPQGISLA